MMHCEYRDEITGTEKILHNTGANRETKCMNRERNVNRYMDRKRKSGWIERERERETDRERQKRWKSWRIEGISNAPGLLNMFLQDGQHL